MSIFWIAFCLQLAENAPPEVRSTERDSDLIEKLVRISRQKYPPADGLPLVISTIRESGDDVLRIVAIESLAAYRTRARRQLPLLQALSGPGNETSVRQAALRTMIAVGGSSMELSQPLYAVIDQEQEPALRQVAVTLISQLNVKDERAEQACMKCLADADPDVCAAAIAAVASLGLTSEPIMGQIRSLIADQRMRIEAASPHSFGSGPLSVDAVECLEKLGVDDLATQQTLQNGRTNATGRLRIACAIALSHFSIADDDKLRTTCREVAKSGDVDCQMYLSGRMAALGTQWPDAPRVLAWLAVAEDEHVRAFCRVTMREVSEANRVFVAEVERLQQGDVSSATRDRAAQILRACQKRIDDRD